MAPAWPCMAPTHTCPNWIHTFAPPHTPYGGTNWICTFAPPTHTLWRHKLDMHVCPHTHTLWRHKLDTHFCPPPTHPMEAQTSHSKVVACPNFGFGAQRELEESDQQSTIFHTCICNFRIIYAGAYSCFPHACTGWAPPAYSCPPCPPMHAEAGPHTASAAPQGDSCSGDKGQGGCAGVWGGDRRGGEVGT